MGFIQSGFSVMSVPKYGHPECLPVIDPADWQGSVVDGAEDIRHLPDRSRLLQGVRWTVLLGVAFWALAGSLVWLL